MNCLNLQDEIHLITDLSVSLDEYELWVEKMSDERFLKELIKEEAKKIASEKSGNFIAIVTLIGIFLAGCIAGMIEGENYGSRKAKQSVIQELCEKQQYDFCETSKVIYKIKENK